MKIDNRDIYEQVGNLFYAIAADQHVKPLEIPELKLMISKDWLPRNLADNKSQVSDETHYILMTMDWLEGNKASARGTFQEFSHFFAKHPDVFTKELKQQIFDTAVEITKIFKADNPFENTYLKELERLLDLSKVTKS